MSKIQLDMYIYISERNAVRRISPGMVTGTHGCVCFGYEHEDHDVSTAMCEGWKVFFTFVLLPYRLATFLYVGFQENES